MTLAEAFNKPREVHSFCHGVHAALYREQTEPEHPESLAEPHYWKAGFLLGRVLKWYTRLG